MKIQTLEINNFKGLKKFKIENLPDFVVLTGESGAGKSSIIRVITYLKDNMISPDRQPMTSDSQCHE
jgi:predicted ATPase